MKMYHHITPVHGKYRDVLKQVNHGKDHHGVLKQGNHGEIPWCFETGKSWYTIHLPYTIHEKTWSTM